MTPLELARQTLIQLSKRRIPPTPENFRQVYNEIAGIESADSTAVLIKSLENVLLGLCKNKSTFADATQKISTSLKQMDTIGLEDQLRQIISSDIFKDEVNWGQLLRYLLKQLEVNHTGLTLSRKKEDLNRVLDKCANDPRQLSQKVQALITSWGDGQSKIQNIQTSELDVSNFVQEVQVDIPYSNHLLSFEYQLKLANVWRDLLIRTINLIVIPQLSGIPNAADRIQILIKKAETSKTIEEVEPLNKALKSILLRAEMQADSQHRMQESLIEMLRLLVASMSELTIEDSWLNGEIKIIQNIISNPLNLDVLNNAENSLKDLIFKQASIKPGLIEAKDTLKNMINTFVSGLADITNSTGTYQNKISEYQKQIEVTENLSGLNNVLKNLVCDIGALNKDAHKSHNAFQETRMKVEEAEKQISELTIKLDYISEIAHQDFLTGALNRRGMDEAVKREFSRADRHNMPLSLAMIDIDHFKKINDTMGHSTGDVALAHLAKVIKSVLRSTDILARYGGEEFVILLPGSKQDDAVKVMASVQRDLTKKFFLHNNDRVLITFSAGVAERMPGEQIDNVLPRADAALYIAKQTGRNRVVGAAELNYDDIINSATSDLVV